MKTLPSLCSLALTLCSVILQDSTLAASSNQYEPSFTFIVDTHSFTLHSPTQSFTADTLSSATTPSSAASTPSANNADDSSDLDDINTIHERRLPFIVASATKESDISSWLSTLQADGSWPASEVDYTTGCAAQRANWPAQDHWKRLVTMTSAFHGGLDGAEQWVNSTELQAAISLAMDFWFSNDFTNPSCIDTGGRAGSTCPCGSPGLWNTNWFSNIIGIPELVMESCLLMNASLTPSQVSNCTNIGGRSYGSFNRKITGVSNGILTGANTLDVASIGIDLGLFTLDSSLLADAYNRVHNEVAIQQALAADGIRPDGSFGQHDGIIYNGNYGKDYVNSVLGLELQAANTQFQANTTSRKAFEALIDGDLWMIYRNIETGVLHWDFSVLGRFISFPAVDDQATGSIKINTSEVKDLGEGWGSNTLTGAFDSLSENSSDANAGSLNGNRVFYDNDYMVQRGPGYVSTLRMYSSRTTNTECTNSQNPLGFHLSDGTVYTYLMGSEYEDIAAAWDWNLIPGTTVDYAATPLTCDDTGATGIESFVGGVSIGNVGVGAMRYTNPLTGSLHWQKAWFFLEGGAQHVMINNISSTTDAPVLSVLDQRKHTTDIYVDGVPIKNGNFSNPWLLWHGNVGYTFSKSSGTSLNVDSGPRTGNWSAIGISKEPPPTVDLFSAWLSHSDLSTAVSYTAFPALDYSEFLVRSSRVNIIDITSDASVSAVYDAVHSTAMIVFWAPEGGNMTIPSKSDRHAPVSISADKGLLLILKTKTWTLTVADPTQNATDVNVILQLGHGKCPDGWTGDRVENVSVTLPTSGSAGSSVSIPLF